MLKHLGKLLPLIFVLINSTAIGYFLYKVTGRQLPTDFVRPFIITALLYFAIYPFFKVKYNKTALFTAFITTLLSIFVTVFFLYYREIDSYFTGDDVIAMAQSNIEEIFDFLTHYFVNEKNLIASAIALGSCFITTLALFIKSRFTKVRYKKLNISCALLFIIAAIVITSQLRPIKYYRLMVENLQTQLETFHNIANEMNAASSAKAFKDKKGELYVLVIGESLCRDSMGVYNKSIDNTPFLQSLALNGKTVVFDNAYSSFVNTVPSITASFSQGNLHTGLTFPHGENLISMAKKAGFKTYWISNQVKNGNADTPIGAISSLADESFFTTNFVFDGSYSQKPDMVLIPKLKEFTDRIDSKENNLVIVHLMGSHSPYYNRYPEDYTPFRLTNPAYVGTLAKDSHLNKSWTDVSDYDTYLTSIKYNDEVLSEIYKIFSDRPDYSGFVYYSDHAEANIYISYADGKNTNTKAPAGRHNVAQFTYTMTRIPFIVSVSDSYKDNYYDTFETLVNNRFDIVTNDTIYDFMLNFMQVKSEAINYKLSVASDKYDIGTPDKVMLVGDRVVGDDPDFIANINAHKDLTDNIYIKSANALFKASTVLAKGYEKVQVDLVEKNGDLFVKVLQDVDDNLLALDGLVEAIAPKSASILTVINTDGLNNETVVKRLFRYQGNPNILFTTDNKALYTMLETNKLNAIYKVADEKALLDVFEDTAIKAIYVNVDLKDKLNELLQAHSDRAFDIYLDFNYLSVQDKALEESLKSVPFATKGQIVQYYNAFNSDF